LILEKLEASQGQKKGAIDVFHDPSHACVTSVDPEFRKTMLAAFGIAVNDVNEHADLSGPGRWGLYEGWHPLRQNTTVVGLHPAAEANRDSASGAALLGWRFTLLKKWPHERVIAIAKADATSETGFGELAADGFKSKIDCIVSASHFDTILVATRDNARLVATQLGPKAFPGDSEGIRVIVADRDGYQIVSPGDRSFSLYKPPARNRPLR
jgi:hypothetical protein